MKPWRAVFLGFGLAMFAGVAGAVTFPKTPDSINLKASEGISIGTRAGQWEFSNAVAGAEAKAEFTLNLAKGPVVQGLLSRAIGRDALIAAARGGLRLIGPTGIAIAIVAPIVWDAATKKWMNTAAPGPGQMDPLMPSPDTGYPAPYEPQVSPCDDHPQSAARDANTWRISFCGPACNTGDVNGAGARCERLSGHSPNFTGDWAFLIFRTSPLAQCLGEPNALFDESTGACEQAVGAEATDSDMDTAIGTAMDASPTGPADVASWVNDNDFPMESADPQTSGPSTVPGYTDTSTVTDDSGTTTTTKKHDYAFQYQGDTVTGTDTETDTVTTPDGQSHVTTSTETTDGSQPPPTSADTTDLCVEHVDASGCAPLGNVDDQDLQQQDAPVTFAYSSVAGSCPAPHDVLFLGQTLHFTYDGPCQFATGIRPVVIALALLGALWLIVKVGHG